jgi:very-short-patch-repair endonuclease
MNKEKDIIEMYNEGKSTYEIAKTFGTYANKIRRILIKHGIEMKSKSEAQKNAINKGVSNTPTKGKKRSYDDRIKISEGLRRMWKNMDEETYNKYVERGRERWDQMSEAEKKEMHESAMQSIRVAGVEGSKLEKFLVRELTKNGHVVEFHKKNLIANQNLEIDMYIPAFKTIIEIDGPSHFLPIWGEDKLQKQIKADSTKTGLILSKGFVIIRIKSMKDKVSIDAREKLKDRVLTILSNFEDYFPKTQERYIEVEI